MSPKKVAKIVQPKISSAGTQLKAGVSSNAKQGERVLIVEAHPDDCAFFMGGTAAKLATLGKQIRLITVTTGDQSSLDPTLKEKELVELVAGEHANAMKCLGITDHKNLGFTNHFLSVGEEPRRVREALTREIRTFQPSTVFSFDPFHLYDENPDHPLVGRMTWEAAAFAAYPNFHPEMIHNEGLARAYVHRMLMFTPQEPNYFVDIAGEPIARKIAAGASYLSQFHLYFDEIKYRLGPIAKDIELEIPERTPAEFAETAAEAWELVCSGQAEGIAAVAQGYYSQHSEQAPCKKLELAEGFHIVFLGILEQLHDILVPELLEL